MNQLYRISFGIPGREEHETLNFAVEVKGRGNSAFYQLRAAREIVRLLRFVAPNAVLEQLNATETEWTEVEVFGGKVCCEHNHVRPCGPVPGNEEGAEPICACGCSGYDERCGGSEWWTPEFESMEQALKASER